MKSKYLDIKELVSPAIFTKYGEASWKMVDTHIIEFLDELREATKRPLVINNYHKGGKLVENGVISIYSPSLKSFAATGLIPNGQQIYGREFLVSSTLPIGELVAMAKVLSSEEKHLGILATQTFNGTHLRVEFINQ